MSADPSSSTDPARGMDGPTDKGAHPERRGAPQYWVSTAYFAEGFPYGLVNSVIEILFQQLGASLKVIGLTSLFHLPWNLKFLWGPFVDQYETKRRWLVAVEVALSVALFTLAFTVAGAAKISLLILAAVLILAFLSATHDIAIDGFYLEALNEREQSTFVGFRATFYRLATISLSGPLLWLVGRSSWFVGLLAVAFVMTAITAYHAIFLPRPESRKEPWPTLVKALLRPRFLWSMGALALLIAVERTTSTFRKLIDLVRRLPFVDRLSISEWAIALLLVGLLLVAAVTSRRSGTKRDASAKPEARESSAYVRSFTSFMDQNRALLVLGFVLLFRTGESFLVKMRWPFLSRLGMSLDDYAIFNGTIGIIASFSATLVGGWLIGRFGLRRCIWPFVFAQNFLNLLYSWLGTLAPDSLSPVLLGAVISVEHAGSGLGTAVFMVYLMRCCDPGHKAAHMAILTALMSVSFTVAGVASGFLAEGMGFVIYFAFTFAATIPSMAMIPYLPYLDHGRGRGGAVPPA